MGRLTDWMRDQGGPAAVAAMTGLLGATTAAFAGKKQDAGEDEAVSEERAEESGSDSAAEGRKASDDGGKDGGRDGGRNRDESGGDSGVSAEGGRDRGGDGGRNRHDGGNGGDGDGDHLSRQERLREITTRQRGDNPADTGDTAGGDNSGGDTYSPTYRQEAPPAAAPSPVAGGGTNGNASIQTPDGAVLAGYNPATQSMTASSGNVTASVGPNGPLVIISDEEVLNVDTGTSPDTPLPSPGQLPEPQPGTQPTPAPQPPTPPDGGGGNPNDPGFAS